jgi:agmatine deiminase
MTPAQLGYRMPPEWAPQEAVWLSWPVANPQHWGGAKLPRIRAKFAEIAAAISRFETVRINAAEAEHDAIRKSIHESGGHADWVELHDHPHDDVWCRDHGPIFVKHIDHGGIAVTDWEFNAWGGKFEPFDQDNTIPGKVAAALNLPCFKGGMVLEGGAIEVNSFGQLLTTEAVLLNPNRNPDMDRRQIEQRLRDFLGAIQVMWLERGIEGDDTDGHVDDLARFVDDTTIVASLDPERSSPNHAALAGNLRRLHEFLTPCAKPFDIVEIPLPDPCEVPGWRLPVLPASYVNFLILNEAVLIPTFGQPRGDDRAVGILNELFPGREPIAIDCLELVEEGGSLHCISMQQPL